MKEEKKQILFPVSELEMYVRDAFEKAGHTTKHATVARSKEPALADYQCNGAFATAKEVGCSPMEVAEKVTEILKENDVFKSAQAATPGFINLTLSDTFILKHIQNLFIDNGFDIYKTTTPQKIILDYGGANVAKPLHVGHLRPAIIGEALKRIGRFVGNEIIGDVHLGDWGLQMGMVITELKLLQPELPYFDPSFEGDYPKESPVTIDDLEKLYPEASRRAKDEEEVMREARKATVELQNGRRGYRALWKHFLEVSIADLKENYEALGVTFDLWLGESDAHDEAVVLVDSLQRQGLAHVSEGAVVMDVAREGDKKELPPLILKTSDGSLLYSTTDLATLKQRMETYCPDAVIYVTDKRQALHFTQVFRAAESAGITDTKTKLEHIGFGTMNGTDNKPFKTREGGTLKLRDLINLITENAKKRIDELKTGHNFTEEEKNTIAHMIGNATLKFADLSNHYSHDYVFDIERFSSFEGYTGPYLLYSTVRANAILEKAKEASVRGGGTLMEPRTDSERNILLELLTLPRVIQATWEERSPSILADYAYDLADTFSTFYHDCPVLKEESEPIRASRLTLVQVVKNTLTQTLELLGMTIPEKM